LAIGVVAPEGPRTGLAAGARWSLRDDPAAVLAKGVGPRRHLGAAASEAFGANVEADARRAAKGMANQLKPFFASKGWIILQ
jgi:hypothetical protein